MKKKNSKSQIGFSSEIYNEIITKFQKAGEFFTPRDVIKLLTEILKPQEGMSICDPTCGTGGTLIESCMYVEAHGGNPNNLVLDGQERNKQGYEMCKMNLILRGVKNYRLELGDVLKNPKLVDKGKLKKYDRVFGNFPFSMAWDNQDAISDPYGRFRFGIPPKGQADFAFIQHINSILKPQGKAAIICSQGILFRAGNEGKIRKALIERDIIEAVIALPPNLFYETRIPVYVVILNKNKPKPLKYKIMFIYVSEFEKRKEKNFLTPFSIKKIVSVYDRHEEIKNFSKIIHFDNIRKNDYSLSIPKYLEIPKTPLTLKISKFPNTDYELKRAHELITKNPEDVTIHLRMAIEFSILERFGFKGIKSMSRFIKDAETKKFPLPSYDLIYRYYDVGSKRIHRGVRNTPFELKQSIRTVSDFVDSLKTLRISKKEIKDFEKNCKFLE